MRADRPSSTALLIARSTLWAAHNPELRPLVPPEAIAPLEAMLVAAGGGSWFALVQRHEWTRRLILRGERALLPGIIAHYLARKRWLELRVNRALSDGCQQVIVLGAGFDTLAWRLHRKNPGVQFLELDHPATQRPKAIALTIGENLALLPVDLAQALPTDVLRLHPRFSARRRTCVVAEGLLMYFPEARVAEILSDVAKLPAMKVVFTFMAPGPDGHGAFLGGSFAIGAWLRLRREPFAWAISPEHMEDFLRPLGLRLLEIVGATGLRAEVLAPAGLPDVALAEGEHLCLATAS